MVCKKNQGKIFSYGDEFRAVIFDLDNTLLQTDHLEAYRKHNKSVTDRSLIKPEQILIGPELVNLFRLAGFKIGIVTSAPRNYAESLLETFGYKYYSLVASKDTLKAKPSPDPLIKCAKQLQVKPEETLNIGDQPGDLAAGQWCGMMNIDVDTLLSSHLFSYLVETVAREYNASTSLRP